MKVLFLDIDGVLNRYPTKEKFCGFTGLDKALVERFLCWKRTAQPDLKIVLSSSWRIPTAFGDFKQYLRDNGIEWVDETPVISAVYRGLEINTWLDSHPEVTAYAVLDDMAISGIKGNRFVQTSEVHGVQDKHLARINKILYDGEAP